MKKIILLLLIIFLFSSCTKDTNQKYIEIEEENIIGNPNLILDNMQENSTKQDILEIKNEEQIELEQKNEVFKDIVQNITNETN